MKKLLLFLCLLPLLAGIGHAQDEGARQDINLSFMGVVQPFVSQPGTPFVKQNSTLGIGLYLGYRYLLTPANGIEANYSYSRFSNKFITAYGGRNARIHASMQEATFAYVRNFNFKRFNPFLEAGGGLLFFSPIGARTTSLDTQITKEPTVLFGGGIAYELSPSWDLRVQYRGQVFKTTSFGLSSQFPIAQRYVVSEPAIGFAYHF